MAFQYFIGRLVSHELIMVNWISGDDININVLGKKFFENRKKLFKTRRSNKWTFDN